MSPLERLVGRLRAAGDAEAADCIEALKDDVAMMWRALQKLDDGGCFMVYDEEAEPQCDHYRSIARDCVKHSQWMETGFDMCPNCVTPWKCNGPHLTPNVGNERRPLGRPLD